MNVYSYNLFENEKWEETQFLDKIGKNQNREKF